MRLFLVSRRFIIPFLIIFVTHLFYLSWKFWELYKTDFQNKGVPASVSIKWFLLNSFSFVLPVFLLSLITGLVYYFHQNLRKKPVFFQPHLLKNWVAVIATAIVGFVYVSYIEPTVKLRSRIMLRDVIFSNSYQEYKEMNKGVMKYNTDKIKTISRLFELKDSLEKLSSSQPSIGKNMFDMSVNDKLRIKQMNIEIGGMVSYPFIILSFYGIAISFAWFLRRLPLVVPLILSYFLVFSSWYFIDKILRTGYMNGLWGELLGVYGTSFFFVLLATAGLLIIRKDQNLHTLAD